MTSKEKKSEDIVISEKIFRENSLTIIDEMLDLSNQTEKDTTMYVDEFLHSIFFLGSIVKPPLRPEKIFNDKEMFDFLRDCYPGPFTLYSSQLPKRSPFSCFLDMVVHVVGQENEEEIIRRLRELKKQLSRGGKVKSLISFAVCVSQNTEIPDSARYYGVSMSTSGRVPGRIMVAASCLSTWDSHVADAVMTYYPDMSKKSYFNGTIKIPETVRCRAAKLGEITEMAPCGSCAIIFGLSTGDTKEWACGNCAEAESLSNLLKNDEKVKEEARPTSEQWTDKNRQLAKNNVLKHLKHLLSTVNFNWDGSFYTPQRAKA